MLRRLTGSDCSLGWEVSQRFLVLIFSLENARQVPFC